MRKSYNKRHMGRQVSKRAFSEEKEGKEKKKKESEDCLDLAQFKIFCGNNRLSQ